MEHNVVYIGNDRCKLYVGSSRRCVVTEPLVPYDAEIEYLESTGTQYIDTGVNCREIVEATYSFSFSSVPSGVNMIIGAYWDSSPSIPRYQFYYNGGWKGVNYPNYTTTGSGISENGTATAGRIYTATTTAKRTYSSDSTIWVFARNNDNNSHLFASNLRIYSLTIKWGNTIVRDFIPVRVGQVGYLYDRISGQLFGNSGTGDFVLGNDKT